MTTKPCWYCLDDGLGNCPYCDLGRTIRPNPVFKGRVREAHYSYAYGIPPRKWTWKCPMCDTEPLITIPARAVVQRVIGGVQQKAHVTPLVYGRAFKTRKGAKDDFHKHMKQDHGEPW